MKSYGSVAFPGPYWEQVNAEIRGPLASEIVAVLERFYRELRLKE
jgi:hypothetical protein